MPQPRVRPLGALQRNWLRFLEANPGPHYQAVSLRDLAVLQALQRRNLISLEVSPYVTPDKGRTVYVFQAAPADSEAERSEAEQ